jgi:hypothetical protein
MNARKNLVLLIGAAAGLTIGFFGCRQSLTVGSYQVGQLCAGIGDSSCPSGQVCMQVACDGSACGGVCQPQGGLSDAGNVGATDSGYGGGNAPDGGELVDGGGTFPVDGGGTFPVDGGGTFPVDGGGTFPVDGGSSVPVDAG